MKGNSKCSMNNSKTLWSKPRHTLYCRRIHYSNKEKIDRHGDVQKIWIGNNKAMQENCAVITSSSETLRSSSTQEYNIPMEWYHTAKA